MRDRRVIFLAMTVGSLLGGWVPSLWGGGGLTISAVIGSTVGGLAGIVFAFRATR